MSNGNDSEADDLAEKVEELASDDNDSDGSSDEASGFAGMKYGINNSTLYSYRN